LNGGKRALIVSILLFLLWGTVLSAPFRFFVGALRGPADLLTGLFPFSPGVTAIMLTVLFLGIHLLYLWMRNGVISEIIAPFPAAYAVIYHLYMCVVNRTIENDAVWVVLGLAVAVLLILFRADKASRILADAYFYSIPVYLFYEWVMTPVFIAAGLRGDLLSPFIRVGSGGLATDVGDFLGLPSWVWGSFVFVLTLLPILYLSKGRASEYRDSYEFKL